MILLSLFVSLGNSTPITIGLIILMTFIETSLLTFLYFQSINRTLDQINLAANHLVVGGSGPFPFSPSIANLYS
ncbi:hypothetical protein A0128_11775 [Leptospira tipperaryensis]|uniref:Uncharacterized protein n=1 Tax=Leptospira tipperaryensis TaxID=2564040 RepID=A0A1D7UY07_9LEPT|nr:hypothetical protein A0128_11775 [Leptospira tipperaryensis]